MFLTDEGILKTYTTIMVTLELKSGILWQE